MMPEPMLVATLTKSMSGTLRHEVRCSPNAMRLTSLSTSTGAPSRLRMMPGTSTLSQDGMRGGFTGRPVAYSIGPGRPMPTLARSSSERSAVAMSFLAVSVSSGNTTSGPSLIARGSSASARIEEARSVTATCAWLTPTSSARTILAFGRKAKVAGGRPPVELASPAWPIRPAAASKSSRAAIVDRACPVIAARSARVRGCPSRSSWNISPAPVGLGANFSSSSTVQVNHGVVRVQVTGNDQLLPVRHAGRKASAPEVAYALSRSSRPTASRSSMRSLRSSGSLRAADLMRSASPSAIAFSLSWVASSARV